MSDPSLPWLFGGFAAAWLLIAAYIVRLWLAHTRLRDRLERLERLERDDRSPDAGSPPPPDAGELE